MNKTEIEANWLNCLAELNRDSKCPNQIQSRLLQFISLSESNYKNQFSKNCRLIPSKSIFEVISIRHGINSTCIRCTFDRRLIIKSTGQSGFEYIQRELEPDFNLLEDYPIEKLNINLRFDAKTEKIQEITFNNDKMDIKTTFGIDMFWSKNYQIFHNFMIEKLNRINRQRIEKIAKETSISDPDLAKDLFEIEPIKKSIILKTEIFALNQETSSLEDKLKKIK